MAKKETVYQLDHSAAGYPSTDGVVFPGVPGVWERSKHKTAADLGLTDEEAAAAFEENDIPVKRVTREEKK